MRSDETPVLVSHTFDQPVAKVWRAITHHDQMVVWFFENIPDFQAKTGFSTSFPVHSEERTFTHKWSIIEVIPYQKIRYSWSYEEYPGNSILSMQLYPEGNGTRFVLEHRTTADFPENIPEFKRESCINGWEYFIHTRLTTFLKRQGKEG